MHNIWRITDITERIIYIYIYIYISQLHAVQTSIVIHSENFIANNYKLRHLLNHSTITSGKRKPHTS